MLGGDLLRCGFNWKLVQGRFRSWSSGGGDSGYWQGHQGIVTTLIELGLLKFHKVMA